MTKKNKSVLLYSIVALVGCLALNIGIFKDYAFLDANEFIWTADNDPNFKNQFIQGGRFLYAIFNDFVYGSFSNTISDLKWVRLFSLIGCAIFSVQMFYFLLKLNVKVYESALFSFLILTIPSFSVYYSWSATYEIPIVLNLCFFAGLILLKKPKNTVAKVVNYLIALVLVVTSLCLYQSAATIFIIPFVISFIIKKNFTIKRVIQLVLFLGVSLSVYFIVFKVSLYLYQIKPLGRTEINLLKFPVRIVIFYLKEMRMLLYGSGFLVAPILFLIIGSFSFFGFFYNLYKKSIKTFKGLYFVLFLILVLPLSYLPNLLSVDNYVCSRTIAPAAILVLFYQFIFLRQLSIKSKTFKKITLTIVLLLIIFSSVNLNHYITRVHNKEYTAIKAAFNKIPIDNTKNILIIQPKNDFLQEYNFYEREYADEFGHISSSRIWVPKPLFNQIFKERLDALNLLGNKNFDEKIEIYDADEYFVKNENVIVINLIDILKTEFE